MEAMTRLVSIAATLAVVLVAGCSQTPNDHAGTTPEASEVAIEMPPFEADSGSEGEPPDPEAQIGPPRFEGGIFRIGPKLRRILTGRNWTPGCPVPLDDLRLTVASYWTFEGEVRKGPLVLHERVADDVLWVFQRLFRARFPIQEIKLAAKDRPLTPEDYWNRDPRSVTASFNCRPATGSTSLSQHSYGWAIDINPLQNPYVRNDGTVLRHIAKPYRDRSLHRKGMIHDGDIVVRSFAAIGWEWGGHWRTLKDYMHFSLTGR